VGCFASAVSFLTRRYVDCWNNSAEDPPSFTERYTRRDQLVKERELESALKKIPEPIGETDAFSAGARADLWSPVRATLVRSLSRSDAGVMKPFFDSCKEAGEEFASESRRFDPSLSDHEIRQALRNLWVFNSLQFYLGRSVCLTPSSFAYSLLYPYTDNWLDVPGRSAAEKHSLNCWLTSRLSGRRPKADDSIRARLDHLLSMIEREYPHSAFPAVGDSLLAINAAQTRSLSLQGPSESEAEDTLMSLTVEKGGTSVLADGFLVTGRLSACHQEVLYGFGVALQLIDDLQDLKEDRALEHSTPFVRMEHSGSLDTITNRLFHFLRQVVADMEKHGQEGSAPLLPLITQSCDFLVMEAVARYRHMYSRGYVSALEPHVPLRLSYLATMRRRLKARAM
jgi:hypothetical protein